MPSVGPIYKFPVPKLANGTQATTATNPSASTIGDIYAKYVAFFGTTGSTGSYGCRLKEVLNILSEILEDCENISSSNFSATVDYLKGSSFYTNAQTFGQKRIDGICREGFLAYRYYLKTIAGIVSSIYGFLEAGRTALNDLKGATDSDKAHVLIIQLEIYEKFIYEAFQSLCTYYQYNADTKQWDQVINFDPDKSGENFKTQLTVTPYNKLSDLRKTQINCLDSKGEGEPKTSKIQLNVFNSIPLLDRLRYIRYYYSLLFSGIWKIPIVRRCVDTIEKAGKDPENMNDYIGNDGFTYVISFLNGIIDAFKKGKDEDSMKNLLSNAKDCMEGAIKVDNVVYTDEIKDLYNETKKILDSITVEELLKDEEDEEDEEDDDYSVFPEDANTGYPCRPDEKSKEATKDTRFLGALEMFYVGYLIDRDGPINAVASFFEVKVAALRNNLSLLSKKITALNTYLDFINSGMDILNQSQSDGNKKRIPDGAILVLTYLCGQKMYNLFEASNGNKYVVIPSAYVQDEYILVRADESGKRFLMGDCGTEGLCTGNGSCGITKGGGTYGWLMKAHTKAASKGKACWDGDTDWDTTGGRKVLPRIKDGGDLSHISNGSGYFTGLGLCTDLTTKENHELTSNATETYPFYLSGKGDKLEGTFTLPTQLEVSTIIPGSVKYYTTANNPKKVNDESELEDLEENEYTAMIESWTNAFSNKTQYINTAIDTINTDVTVDRSKIDTFDSLTSTFRSRAHDAYTNTASNIRG
jgi:hypothetical protein